MAPNERQRVERALLGGRVTYVQANVLNVYDALLHTIAKDDDSASSSSSSSSWSTSDDSLVSSSLLEPSTPTSSSCSSHVQRKRTMLVPATIGSSDRYATLLGLLSVRDGILLVACVQGFALGTYQIVRAFVIRPFRWEALGQLLFGFHNLGVGTLLVVSAMMPRLWLIHFAETCSTAVVLALSIEFVTVVVKFLVLGIRLHEWLWGSLIKSFAINVTLAAFYGLFGRGLFASFRSIHVVGGTGTERLTWFQILQTP